MDWLTEVREKQKRKNQILFSKDSPVLLPLRMEIEYASRRSLILWALELAGEAAELEAFCPGELRPGAAVAAAKQWAAGEIKMPQAKQAILACHGLAKELQNPRDRALCHAVGQGCSVVHTPGHALGLPIYELTALVEALGVENCRETVERRSLTYAERLAHWKTYPADTLPWAAFLAGV